MENDSISRKTAIRTTLRPILQGCIPLFLALFAIFRHNNEMGTIALAFAVAFISVDLYWRPVMKQLKQLSQKNRPNPDCLSRSRSDPVCFTAGSVVTRKSETNETFMRVPVHIRNAFQDFAYLKMSFHQFADITRAYFEISFGMS